ncbi:DegT/DnrJ/EryC1/StrS family aminotransferase [Gramella jeungdoensis]|uniref:DegT/DnrJ/EryC1/StrS family aminotransferase n=1 Tax=Gramella jeungdoensis TaxID=708091 RepID=A0ABT0Z445_9FLAO|nr:DegT/DnrJ/EryC1/StrS family aminotransferase [Gramella jeungdoensis]MCM8570506.1 DegT/DnrJ/EryC1/StrS family aminotransferase [Gramella jeungdoensis]
MINVTKTFLPPKEEYDRILEEIWHSNQIANGGKLHLELRKKLKERLEVDNIILTANGTLPLQIALNLLGNEGEIITTPFSYVATTSSIVWEKCTPVFVDIDPDYLSIDERKIEDVITPRTTLILATHVFGNPCNVEAIEKIARKHSLKVIYDAAHCFGVKYKKRSIFNYGNLSTCSFHATKLFHTGEGGAIITENRSLHEQLFYRHNFGHEGELAYHGLGINAKMSELQAGMGLAVLPYIDTIKTNLEQISNWYDTYLNVHGYRKLAIREFTEWNYSYYPVIFESDKLLFKVQKKLNEHGVFPRRYFYPSLNKLPYVTAGPMAISESIAERILCLPLAFDLKEKEVVKISKIINSSI